MGRGAAARGWAQPPNPHRAEPPPPAVHGSTGPAEPTFSRAAADDRAVLLWISKGRQHERRRGDAQTDGGCRADCNRRAPDQPRQAIKPERGPDLPSRKRRHGFPIPPRAVLSASRRDQAQDVGQRDDRADLWPVGRLDHVHPVHVALHKLRRGRGCGGGFCSCTCQVRTRTPILRSTLRRRRWGPFPVRPAPPPDQRGLPCQAARQTCWRASR